MKKILPTISRVLLILTLIGVSVVPETTHAVGWLEGPAVSVVNTAFSIIANWILGLTSVLVTVSGIFLSMSINLTMHIGDFFNSIPALQEVWLLVRNISSIFIIFILLYSSITVILGANSSNTKALIGKIIMAGLLINFSLFFVKIAIDASNLVSLQLYRAIAPEYSVKGLGDIKTYYQDGGLSNVFMSSLRIPKIYQNNSVFKSSDVAASISFAAVGGVIMMITASISFFAAAIAFTARVAILIFIMALCPLYFAAMIFPQVNDRAKSLMKLFTGQLIFMPTYLFLMYISLKLLSSPGFSAIFNQSAVAPAGESPFGPTFVGVIVQYIIALTFINLPLIAAIQAGAVGAKWAPDSRGISSFVGQHVLGRASKAVQERFASSPLATKNPNFAIVANKALTGVSSASFGGSKGGYDKRFKEYKKERTDFVKDIELKDSEKAANSEKFANSPAALKLQKDIAAAKKMSTNTTMSAAAKKLAEEQVQLYEKNQKELKEKFDKEALRAKKEGVAQTLEKTSNPVTAAAAKEAAEEIRKEMKKGDKSDNKKIAEKFEKFLQDDGAKPPVVPPPAKA